ncbi:MAG: ferredoxin [Deltaproteobacteria bacterium]|nr:MAG: ferredoxin [Deltaproteobacteria bacterium]
METGYPSPPGTSSNSREIQSMKYTVTFLPDEKSVEVEDGARIAEAAQKAEVFINNLCGGEGVCGQCKVQVTSGRAEAEEQAQGLLSEEEIASGYVLACQTEIHDNLEITIPPETRMEEAKIMTGEAAGVSRSEDDKPLVRKIYLELPPPTLEDNIADIERVSRELRRKIGWHSFDIHLECLKGLPEKLRDNDWKVTVTLARDRDRYRIQRIEPLDTTNRNYGVAIDVGTTTVVAQLVDIRAGEVLGVEGSHNLQASYGEDVISRMIYACGRGGLPPLHEAIIKNINQLIEKLVEKHNVSKEDINAIVAAGNTTMSHFLLGLTPCSIRLEPYVPTADEFPQVRARDLGIQVSSNGFMETIPCVASYVGGDIVAGVMSCGIADHPEVRGLIDIGTNGEIAIGNNEWLVCCSASAGPAFEGGGTRCGMRAIKGAIEKIEIIDGDIKYETIGNAPARGICGSGLIDCIYELVRNGIIGAEGKFDRELKHERFGIEDDIPQYTIAPGDQTETGEPVVITESDIDNLMKSKGAVFAAIKSLTDYIGLSFDQIETFYVAGGFGSFLNIPKAIAIGLLPDIPQEKIQFIGNSSLTGARRSLLSENAFEKCINISRSMTNIELSNYQPFMDEYIAALFLPHTDRKLFPSVQY